MIDIGTHSTKLSNDAMSQSILSVESSASKALFLSEYFDNRIKASLRGLTEECSRNIHIPSFYAEAIYHDERLSPEIHYLHHKLQSSMRAQSALSARQTIEKLIDKAKEERHEQHFINVSSIGTTEWEVFSKQESARLSMLEQSKIDTLTSISQSDLETGKIHIHKALPVIKLIDPELHYEILEHISEAKLFHSTITQSFSDVRTMGAIFNGCVKVYELETPTANHLVICVIDSDVFDFFCIGASFKSTKQAAIRHSLGEAATLFEDVLRHRVGQASTPTATTNILSLRSRQQSQLRKRYFLSLLKTERQCFGSTHTPRVYAFEILDGMFAARASIARLLTPRQYHNNRSIGVPVMPLF